MRTSMLRLFETRMGLILTCVSVILVLSVVFDIAWFSSDAQFRSSALGSSSGELQTGSDSTFDSKIAKLSMLYGETTELYERSLRGHDQHNRRFGYKFFVLREKLLPGYWSKPAYMLKHLLNELAKPADQRLEWLMWVDADVVLMNPNIPLEIFVPPSGWDHVHCLVTNDHRGLNNGVFFLRVHAWSAVLMNACLGTETYDPDMPLKFGDQSALMYWLNQEQFRNNTIHVPQRWFNAYAGFRGEGGTLFSDPMQAASEVRPQDIKEGDLFVHHAGHKQLRAQRMVAWVEAAEKHHPQWELPLEKTTYKEEIEKFWATGAKNERKTMDKLNAHIQKLLDEKKAKAEAAAKAKGGS